MSHNVIDNGMPSVRHPWLAVSSAGLATFAVVTTEMLPVGLLTTLAQALNTSTGSAGMAVSLPALLAALFAPLVVIGSGEIDRRIILRWLLVLLVVANLASALATGMATLLAARVLVGFCMGASGRLPAGCHHVWCRPVPSGWPAPWCLVAWRWPPCWAYRWALWRVIPSAGAGRLWRWPCSALPCWHCRSS